jgi:hypothetical protein
MMKLDAAKLLVVKRFAREPPNIKALLESLGPLAGYSNDSLGVRLSRNETR